MRINELAKKLGVKSKNILSELSKLGIEGKTHSSNIEPELVKTIEEIVLGGGIKQKEQPLLIPHAERLQALERLKKERWKEYLKYDMIERHIEQEKPSEEKNAEILTEKDETEAPLQIEDEKIRTGVSGEREELIENLPVKQKNVEGHRSIIAGLIISAIFIITVLFFTVVNYYVWRDKARERPQTKSLSVQKEKSTGQFESENSTMPQNNEIVSQPLFTIQAGAFNDAYYAKSLKTRLNKKGYHAFITISSSRERRLYKVLVGKFSNRGDAEMLSARIKRAEGLQTFVTLWKKQYFKNSKAYSMEAGIYKCLARLETQAIHFSYYIS